MPHRVGNSGAGDRGDMGGDVGFQTFLSYLLGEIYIQMRNDLGDTADNVSTYI